MPIHTTDDRTRIPIGADADDFRPDHNIPDKVIIIWNPCKLVKPVTV